MKINLLELIGKWITFLCVCVVSLNTINSKVNEKVVYNNNLVKNESISALIVPYETEYQYNAKLPVTVSRVIRSGENGIVYNHDDEKQVVKEVVNEIIEVGTGRTGEYTGRLTNYGADCVGCSKVGNVACLTREGTKHSLTYNGATYKDSEYGELRILAADRRLFDCGTVILVNDTHGNSFYGIVLDTGGSMRKAWSNGEVWLDLASKTQAEAKMTGIGGYNVDYTVQRWGW